MSRTFQPNLCDFQILAPGAGGREARHYNTLLNLFCRGLDRRFILARTERAIVPIFVLESLHLGLNKLYGKPRRDGN